MQLPKAVPTAHAIVTALVMHSDDGAVLVLPVHDDPVYAVVDGVKKIVSPATALLYAFSRFSENTVEVPRLEQYEKSKALVWPVGQSTQEDAPDAPYLPVSQLTHTDIGSTGFALYFPTAQFTQLAVAASTYLPAAHGSQDDAPADE